MENLSSYLYPFPMFPSDELPARLVEVDPYPDGVAAVPGELPFTAFFPGGAGVMLDEQGDKPPFPVGKVETTHEP